MDEETKVVELAKLIFANSIVTNYSTFTRDEGRKLATFSIETAKIFYEVINARRDANS